MTINVQQPPDPWQRTTTAHGLAADEVISALQKSLRRGWLENRVSLQTLCGKYPFFARLAEGKACAQEGEETLRALTDEVGGYLALAIANINCLLDLDTVVLGGYTARLLGERLTDAVNRYLARLSSCHLVCKPQLCTEPSIAGAALLATEQKLQALFSDG